MSVAVNWQAKACPMCNQADRLEVTSEIVYQTVLDSPNCPGSLVDIECTRCNLKLTRYTHSNSAGYMVNMKKLIDGWNKLPRQEDMDDGK